MRKRVNTKLPKAVDEIMKIMSNLQSQGKEFKVRGMTFDELNEFQGQQIININNFYFYKDSKYFLFSIISHYVLRKLVQIHLCQKLLFLHQITHNITTDCSLNSKKNMVEHVVHISCSECQNKNKKQSLYTTCSAGILTLQFS